MLYSWCTLVYPGIPWYTLTVYSTLDILTLNPVYSWAQNLRQGIVMKTSFGTRASRMGLGSFVDINIFVLKYYFIWFLPILHFFESLQSRFTQMLKLGSFVQWYSFKFRALVYLDNINTASCTEWEERIYALLLVRLCDLVAPL